MQDEEHTKAEKSKGGRPPEGKFHGVRIPDVLWTWAQSQTGNASETIRRLLREAMKREQK